MVEAENIFFINEVNETVCTNTLIIYCTIRITNKFGKMKWKGLQIYAWISYTAKSMESGVFSKINVGVPNKCRGSKIYGGKSGWKDSNLDLTKNCINMRNNWARSKSGSSAIVKQPKTGAQSHTIIGAIHSSSVAHVVIRKSPPRKETQVAKEKEKS